MKEYKKPNIIMRTTPNELKIKVENILNQMIEIFGNNDGLLRRQAIIPIYYLLLRYALIQNSINKISRRLLSDFAKKVTENRKIAEEDIAKADFDLFSFDRMTIQGTNDASSIKERLKIICQYFEIEPPCFR